MARIAMIISKDNYLRKELESNEYHLSTMRKMAEQFGVKSDKMDSFSFCVDLLHYDILSIQEESYHCILYIPDTINSYQKETLINNINPDSKFYIATTIKTNVLYYSSIPYEEVVNYVDKVEKKLRK